MRDYDELIERLRYCADRPICFSTQCDYRQTAHIGACFDSLKHDAADAIEELLARASENDWRVCKNCQLQHFDTDGKRWCEELSIVVGDNFYCGFFEGSEPPKGEDDEH